MGADMQRLWCKATKIYRPIVIGYTSTFEKVLMKRKPDDGLVGVQPGDIISFIPYPADDDGNPRHKPAKWFGHDPHVIARRIVDGKPVTRQRPTDACAWKQQKDEQDDAEARRAALV